MRQVKLSQLKFISWRFYVVSIVIILIIVGLVCRIVDLVFIKQHFLQKEGNGRAERVITEPAFRGIITDREGYPLAISTPVYSIWMNPTEFSADEKSIQTLSHIMSIPASRIQKILHLKKKREFVYLKRDLTAPIADQVKALNLTGIYLRQSFKRSYPEGAVASQLVGFTNVDDQGQEGIEMAYNNWLTGQAGKVLIVQDGKGRDVSTVRRITDQKPGSNLALSINHRIQYIAYRELLAGIESNSADSGSVVVLDLKTGEIVAMVNAPSFNPDHRLSNDASALRNRAITDTFEPGSTIKTFTIASALASGHYKPTTVIDTFPGWFRVGKNLVRDEHNNGLVTVTQVLQLSSNIGAAKMVLSLPPDQLWQTLHAVGFGQETGIGFPGERSGELTHRDHWSPFGLATLSFGYGMSATALQLTQAYGIIANQGIKVPLSLLRVNTPPVGQRVMSDKVANQMMELLEAVVSKDTGKTEQRTGKAAMIPGYRIAGKTGTAKIVGAHGYEKHRYVSSFVGIAPVSNPRFVVTVIIHDPRGKHYYASEVSAPIFKNIMEATLHLLNVPPDDLSVVPASLSVSNSIVPAHSNSAAPRSIPVAPKILLSKFH